jgi:GAF domain-containing protein
MSQPITLPPTTPTQGPAAPWRQRTLERLVQHVRTVLPVSAAAFVTDDGAAASTVGWFADEELRAGMEASMSRLTGGGTLLLPRVEAWQAAPELMDALAAELGQERARVAWATFRKASLIASPVRGEFGSQLGMLVVASLEGRRRLGKAQQPTVEALADLAAISLERTSLLDAEGRRARDELRLKHAAEAISSTLDPAEVYVRVARHAAGITGASCALLTRLNTGAGDVRTAATVDCPEELAAQLSSLDSAAYGEVARTRAPLVLSGAEAAPLGSLMHAPIELGPRLYGVLTVGHEQPEHFSDNDLELLVKLARSSAAAIANAVRVRQDGRWKIRQKFRFCSARGKMRACFLRFSSIACDSSACTCSGENSSSVIRLMPFIEFDMDIPNRGCEG